MTKFAPEHRYPSFVWLGSRGANWVARDQVPESLLRPHDQALAALDINPNDMRAAVAWMDAVDAIFDRVNPILDGPALRAFIKDEMQKRELDAMLRHRFRPSHAL